MNSEPETTDSSMSDIAFGAKEYKKLFLRNKKWLLLIAFAGAAIGLGISFWVTPKYTAQTTFMMDSGQQNAGGLGSYLQLAGQLGILPGGGGLTLDEDKVLEILKSRRIISRALFQKAKINAKNDILANHYIDVFELREKLEKTDSLKGFKFTHFDPEKLSYTEDSILNLIYADVNKTLVVDKSSKSGIITLIFKAPSDVFAKTFCDELVGSVTEFYLSRKTEKNRNDLETIQSVTDSIGQALTEAQYEYARWKDASYNMIKAQGYVEEIRLMRKAEILNIMHGEALKNLEMSKFNLLMNSPVLQLIDYPVLPLEKPFEARKLFKALCMLVGFVLALTLSYGFLVVRDLVKDSERS